MATTRTGTVYSGGNRYYIDPNNPTRRYIGVTSVLNAAAKPGVEKAKQNAIRDYAAHNRKSLAEGTKAAAIALLKDEAVILPDWKVGRDYGTAVHQVIENLVRGQDVDYKVDFVEGTDSYPVSNTFADWVPRVWEQFVKEHNVKILDVEQTVLSDRFGYGGSFDLVAEVDGKVTILDAKSNRKGPQPSVALQNMLYSRADYIVDMATGAKRDMHKIEASGVLWLTEFWGEKFGQPEPNFTYIPLQFDEEVWRAAYAHVVLAAWEVKKNDAFLIEDGAAAGFETFKPFGR